MGNRQLCGHSDWDGVTNLVMRNRWVVLAVTGMLAACGLTDALPVVPQHFDGQLAHELVAAQLALGPRYPGSEGHRQVQARIEADLGEAGWAVERFPFEVAGIEVANLVSQRRGAGDGPWILLGAHYDTRPIADEDPVSPAGPVPGANDGASGVAVLLELARVIDDSDLACQLSFALFDAEDSGRLEGWDWAAGSAHYVATRQELPDLVVIVDMIGDADLQIPRERNSHPELVDSIWATAAQLGYTVFEDRPGYSIFDDHSAFLARGVPAADLIDFDYPYWHTTQDTLDKVSAASLEAVGRTLQAWLETEACDLANRLSQQ